MKIPGFPRISDSADQLNAAGAGTLPGVVARLSSWNAGASKWDRIVSSPPSGDSYSTGTNGYVGTFAVPYGYNGTSFDRIRFGNIFKSFASTAITAGVGMTIWTPAAGKKFRLMGWSISTSVAGALIFGDNAVGTIITRSPTLAAAGFHTVELMGNGFVSAAANNVLKLDGPTGNVAGQVWGVEE